MGSSIPADIQSALSAITGLCKRYGVRSLHVFGSASTDSWDAARSDFDFVVSFLAQPASSIADRYLGLAEGLESLLGRPVDLITEASIRNPYFRRNVDETRVSVYAA